MAQEKRRKSHLVQGAIGFIMLGAGLWWYSPALALIVCGTFVGLDALLSISKDGDDA